MASGAWGAEPLKAGSVDLGLAGGFSISHDRDDPGLETVHGIHVIPHLGLFVTDEAGTGALRGNFELLAEPTVIRLESDTASSTMVGFSAFGRWLLGAGSRIRPYVEFGLGILAGEADFRQTDCDLNFIIAGGPGVLFFLTDRAALTAGYRFEHISNAGSCDQNLGLNSSLFVLGISYFIP